MAIKLYDTLSRKKKGLNPRSDKKIEIFVCGPTVYDYSHIGHARTYIVFDAFVKYLKLKKYEVRYIQNITDIDDKIIARAKELSQSPADLARNFETEYYHDMESLGVDGVDKYARATDYIPQIISQVQRLLDKGYAYEIENNGIYFDISKFDDYGKLSGRSARQAEDAVSRIDESVKKKNKGDFTLWKFSPSTNSGQENLEARWQSPWGDGRPGWHIEDTAITEAEFGAQYDIHGGARDLMFPHHESEIAQMESLSSKVPLVNYWMHTGFLTVGGEKMAKSLGNFITIHEFLRNHSKETLRLLVLSSHYRSPIDYTEAAVLQAEANVRRLGEFYAKVKSDFDSKKSDFEEEVKKSDFEEEKSDFNNKKSDFEEFARDFTDNLDDDFNTPKAIAVLFELVRKGNVLISKGTLNSREAEQILELLNSVKNVFGIIPEAEMYAIPEETLELAKKREQLRKEEKWGEADKIRTEIEKLGYSLEDTSAGPVIKKEGLKF